MTFKPLSRIQSESLAKYAGLRRNVDAVRVMEASRKALEGLWGADRAAYMRPVSFKDGELKLAASASVVVGELKHEEVRLMNEVNRMIGSRVVRSIKVVQA
ncbi:DUF721 domain-containing protein [Candidatus Uhrbacteria bacterium]|nr:MAG: DUF721 domain-containing protein [Candidatus Uhrbacteria bacterium]